jgi:hypothetical protein
MSEFSKGGRGKRAPYTTEHYRIPTPLKPAIHQICTNYKELIQNYYDPCDHQLIDSAVKGISYGHGLISELDNRIAIQQALILELRSQLDKAIDIQAKQVEILTQALRLRANAGGAIKREIEKAIALGKNHN